MKRLVFLIAFAGCLRAGAQQQPSITAFDRIIDSLYKPGEPGGVALVTRHGAMLYNRAFGMANLELSVPMRPDNVFEIGSITKQFTAVCILQLMEQGKLHVSDLINKYLAGCPAAWGPVTIENLLTHTSGINDMPGQQSSLAELLKNYQSAPLAFTPGTKWAYNNVEYILLGYIIEALSNTAYRDYLEKNTGSGRHGPYLVRQ